MNKRLKKSIFFYSITLGLGINMVLTSHVKAETVSTDQNSHIQIINNKKTESSATNNSQNVEKTQPELVNNEKKNQNSTFLLDNQGTEKQSQGNNTSSSDDKHIENRKIVNVLNIISYILKYTIFVIKSDTNSHTNGLKNVKMTISIIVCIGNNSLLFLFK